MGEKSANKRLMILEKARDIFSKQGYSRTTMNDVVSACEISRGGVYLYFDNIKDLFEAVMNYEYDNQEDLSEKIPEDASFADVLALIVKEKKKEILGKKNNLSTAIYEYYFENKIAGKKNLLKNDFDSTLYVLEQVIQGGIDAGEFYDIDAHRAASNLMYVFEGLKISARTRNISESVVDEEIMYVMQGIIAED
ncbi:MAG: TetR/AcrR family transcriptional regulator [Lachnospiraceae bacterium]|nr:TetR/AcrR family transcriptional regulator [Lachnospiraceae bacterium]